MLKSLLIKDYALIETIEVSFNSGLNIITGETGAGKSIIIDAMNMLLGVRASSEVVRKGSLKSIIEGVFELFENRKVKELFELNEIEVGVDEIIVRREISVKGSSRCFINDTPVNLSTLKELGNLLVDLHGQHEHQSLLRSETHIEYLDEYCGNSLIIDKYKKEYTRLQSISKQLREITNKIDEMRKKREYLIFQISEIMKVDPQEEEDEKIISELNLLETAEKRLSLSSEIAYLLNDSDNSIVSSIHKVKKYWEELVEMDQSLKDFLPDLTASFETIKEANKAIRSYSGSIDHDSENLNKLRGRLAEINLLKKKYGLSLAGLINHRKRLEEEIKMTDSYQEEINMLREEVRQIKIRICDIGKDISDRRKRGGVNLTKDVIGVLGELGMPNSKFDIRFNLTEAGDGEYLKMGNKNIRYFGNGFDDVEFFISTNLGEDLKPLAKVASGGEISRIMLSLKTALALKEKLPLLIFDEIDTGISGRIGQKVGLALKKLSAFYQIIAITHLPQIAGLATNHYHVEKSEENGRVLTTIRKLSEDERVIEVAKLLGGEHITDSNRETAKELMKDN